MGSPVQLLPDDIHQKQICQNCFQYLSVPPISFNKRGEIICGRCPEELTSTRSLFNVIAEGFTFKCTNHLNGCKEILSLSETTTHEKTCSYVKQECLFCSFAGNISQLLNHSLKLHQGNVSLDGKVSFLLNNEPFQKSILLVLNGNIFLSVINLTEEVFTITISPMTSPILPTINQYGIKFFKSNDPTNIDNIHRDYGLLNNNMETYFKKSKEELVSFFGLEAKLTCEILLQKFELSEKEFEINQRYAKLRQSEEQLGNSRRELQAWAQKLSQQNESYNSAMNVIKRLSYEFFKCHSCKEIIFEDVYFCPKNHCCCKTCLTNMCKTCNSVQEFNRFKDIDTFLINCDWPGCKKSILYKDYIKHKSECLQRSYKCPLLNCHEVVLSSQKLVEHWHCLVPSLNVMEQIVVTKKMATEYYWLIEGDLYHVLINFDDSIIQVLVSEVNVLPNNISFKCEGTIKSGWKILTSTKFCGKFQVNMNNSFEDHIPSDVIVVDQLGRQKYNSSNIFNTGMQNFGHTATARIKQYYKYDNLRITYIKK